MINKNYSPPSSRHAYSKTYSVKCYKHIREGCSWWNSGVTHIMAVESAGKWGFQIRNKQKKKNDILKHDHVSVQACLVNKMQKSCGEGQSLSNTASAKLFQNTKFSRDIPEVSTALYSFFFFLNKLLKLERSLTDITVGSVTGTREEKLSSCQFGWGDDFSLSLELGLQCL